MENIYIYLAGGMSGLTIEEQVKWRNNFKNIFKYNDIEIRRKPIIFSPPDYYSFSSTHDNVSEKEIMDALELTPNDRERLRFVKAHTEY